MEGLAVEQRHKETDPSEWMGSMVIATRSPVINLLTVTKADE